MKAAYSFLLCAVGSCLFLAHPVCAGTSQGQGVTQDEAIALRQHAAVRAALDTIAFAEVGTIGVDGYSRYYGVPPVFAKSLKRHPAIFRYMRVRNRDTYSTSCGRYQFIKRTWDEEVADLGLRDFGPLSQDLAAIDQLVKVGAIENIVRRDLNGFFSKASKVWASLPGSPYDSPARPAKILTDTFSVRYAFYRRRGLHG
ncbi:MAG: hypothetical protein M1549_00425 [Candidatus Dependentiae bacterium]|nr:hypothetical protein [Candidatus Dependentiae bacterium]